MRFSVLAVPLMILYMAVTYVNFVDYQRESYVNLQERHLDIAINYAVDAATEYMTEGSTDLGLDYQDFENMNTDPMLALEMYELIMLRNLGFRESPDNIAYLESCTPLFVVAGYDGYYLARDRRINVEGEYKLIFNPKMPYTWTKTVGNETYLFGLNLGLQDAIRYYDNGNGGRYDRILLDDSLITEDEQKRVISSVISEDMFVNLWDILGGGAVTSSIYIPSDMTTWTHTNPINATTVLAYVDGLDLGLSTNYSSFGIGGARIVHESFVVCWNGLDGHKYYTYTDSVPNGVSIVDSYLNPMNAAENGYEFWMGYFNRE